MDGMDSGAASHGLAGDTHLLTGPEDSEGSGRLPEQPAPLYNGCVILTLRTKASCWGPGFDYRACGSAFAVNGLQIPAEDYEFSLHQALNTPEIRRFLCLNSFRFLMILLPVLYVLTWCILFSTFHLFLRSYVEEHLALFCLVFSTMAVAFTGAVALLLWKSCGQVIVDSDVRLMRANEGLRRHQLLVGLSDCKNYTGRLQLTFCFFDVGDCLQRLTQLLDANPDSQNPLQAKVCQKLGRFYVSVIDGGFAHLKASGAEEMDSEETPLLDRGEEGKESHDAAKSGRSHSTPAHTVAINLLPGGTPQEAASQLLTLYSAVYARLLGTEQLPRTARSLHAREAAIPCLCQHIEGSLTSPRFP